MGLTADRTFVTPGDACELIVHVANDADHTAAYQVRIVGLATEWTAPPAVTDPLEPGASQAVRLLLRLPYGFPASTQLVALVAEPIEPGSSAPMPPPAGARSTPGTMRAEAELVVGDGHDVVMRIEPSTMQGRGAGRFDVEVTNRTSTGVYVRLEADVPAGNLAVGFNPVELAIPPGASARSKGAIRGRRFFTGPARRLPFAVVGRGPVTPPRASASWAQGPVVSSFALKTVAVLAVFALWAAGMVAGFQYLEGRGDEKDEVAGQLAGGEGASDGAGGAAGGEAGDGSGDGAGGQGFAPGEGGGGDGEIENTGVRVGGTVTASQPAGVVVRLEPVALIEEGAQLAQPTGNFQPTGAVKRVGPATTSRAGFGVGQTRQTTTDETGAWAFAGVPNPGFYLVSFSKAGYSTRSHVIETSEEAEPVELDVILETGTGSISGTVTGPDGPLGGVDIVVSDGTVDLGTSTPTSGDGVGAWSISGLTTPGSYLVTASAFGFGTETSLVELSDSGSATVDLVMQAGVGSLTGVVSSIDGPIGNVEVTVTDGTVTRSATTLTEGVVGSYSLPSLPIPGRYTVTAGGDGWATSTQEIELTGNMSLPIGLEPMTGVIYGVVTGADGPLAGAGLTLTSDALTMKNTSVADPPGSYELNGVPPGVYVLQASFAGLKSESTVIELAQGERKEVPISILADDPIVIPVGSISGSITHRTTGDPVPNVEISVVDPVSDPALAIPPVTTDADGVFLMPNVPPGTHNVQAKLDGFNTGRFRTVVPANGVGTVTFALIPYSSVSGVVRSASDGAPIEGATVTITGLDPALPPVTTDVDGRYGDADPPEANFTNKFPPGTYEITASATGYVPMQAPRRFVIVENRDEVIDLRLDKFAQLRVFPSVPVAGALQPAIGTTLTLTGIDITHTETKTITSVDELPAIFDAPQGVYQLEAEFPEFQMPPLSGLVLLSNRVYERSIVLFPATAGVVTGTVNFQRDGVANPLPFADVAVTGTVGYNTATNPPTPIVNTKTVQTDANGNFAIARASNPCPALVTCGVVPLDLVGDVVVSHDNFETRSIGRVTFPAAGGVLAPYTLTGKPARVDGTVTFTGVASPALATISVTSAPVGSGTVTAEDRTLTGSQMTYTLQDPTLGASARRVRPGSYTVQIKRNGFVDATEQIIVTENGDQDLATTLRQFGSITATAKGCPSPQTCPPSARVDKGATFTVFRLVANEPDQSVETKESGTGSNKSVTFNNLDPNFAYRVEAEADNLRLEDPPGFPVVTHNADTSFDELLPGGTVSKDVLFTILGQIRVEVRGQTGASSALLSGVTVKATGTNGTTACQLENECRAVTGDDGIAFITDLPDGDYTVTVPGDTVQGYVATGVEGSVTGLAGNESENVQLNLNAIPATLKGKVTKPDGTAIEGALVRVFLHTLGEVHETTTNAQGNFAFEDNGTTDTRLPPAPANVEFSAANFRTVTIVGVPLARDTETTMPTVALQPQFNTVVGTATATHGTQSAIPLVSATVTAVPIAGQGTQATTTTDSNGRFVPALQLANGSYRIEVRKTGYTPPSTDPQITVSGDEARDVGTVTLAVRLRTVKVTVTTIDENGNADKLNGVSVTLDAQAGPAVDLTASTTGSGANEGIATFTDVIPGSYIITAAAGGTHQGGTLGTTTTPLSVPFSDNPGNSSVDFTVPLDEGVLKGTATVDGANLAGVFIQAVGTPGTFTTSTAANGTYTLFVPPGTYTVSAMWPGATVVTFTDTVTKANVTTIPNLNPVTKVTLNVFVRRVNGTPIPGVDVTVTAGGSGTATTNGQGMVSFTLSPGVFTVAATVGGDTRDATTQILQPGTSGTAVIQFPNP